VIARLRNADKVGVDIVLAVDVEFRNHPFGHGECEIPVLFGSKTVFAQSGAKRVVMPVLHVGDEVAIAKDEVVRVHLKIRA